MTAFPQLAAEFPDFDQATLPAIPETWREASWHNDACPSFYAFELTKGYREDWIIVYVDYAEPEMREFPTFPRFIVITSTDRGETSFEHDDWNRILLHVAEETALLSV